MVHSRGCRSAWRVLRLGSSQSVAVDGAEDRCRMSDAVVDALGNSGVVWNAVWHRFGVAVVNRLNNQKFYVLQIDR